MNKENQGRVTISALAQLSAVDRRTLTKICAALPPDDKGRFALSAAVQAVVAHFRQPDEDREERRALLRARREKAEIEGRTSEIEFRKMTGELLPRAWFQPALGELLEQVRLAAQFLPEEQRRELSKRFLAIDVRGMAENAANRPEQGQEEKL